MYIYQQIEFKEVWRLRLNLCSQKLLRPVRSLATNLIHLGLWQLKRLLEDGLINYKIFFAKSENYFYFED